MVASSEIPFDSMIGELVAMGSCRAGQVAPSLLQASIESASKRTNKTFSPDFQQQAAAAFIERIAPGTAFCEPHSGLVRLASSAIDKARPATGDNLDQTWRPITPVLFKAAFAAALASGLCQPSQETVERAIVELARSIITAR